MNTLSRDSEEYRLFYINILVLHAFYILPLDYSIVLVIIVFFLLGKKLYQISNMIKFIYIKKNNRIRWISVAIFQADCQISRIFLRAVFLAGDFADFLGFLLSGGFYLADKTPQRRNLFLPVLTLIVWRRGGSIYTMRR